MDRQMKRFERLGGAALFSQGEQAALEAAKLEADGIKRHQVAKWSPQHLKRMFAWAKKLSDKHLLQLLQILLKKGS